MNRRLLGLACLATAMMLAISAIPALATQTLEKSQEWKTGGNTVANGVYAADVDADNRVEILTVGSATTLMGVTQANFGSGNGAAPS